MPKYQPFQQIQSQVLLTEQEAHLIRLLFHEVPAHEERELYRNLVFDDEKQSFLLLLARLARRNGFAYAPPELIPRLQGLLRYHGVNNKVVLQPILTLADCQEQSPVMLYGHSAMYGYYDGENPRIMGIGGAWVAPGTAEKVLRCAVDAGFHIRTESSLAANLKNSQGNLNLHKLVHLQADPQIWKRGKEIRFQNRSMRVTDCADTLILMLRSEFRWWCIQPRHERNIKWYYDCACMIKHPDFPGWEALAERAEELGSLQTVHLMLCLFDRAFPGWIPEDFWSKLPQCKKKELAMSLQYGIMGKQYEANKEKFVLTKAMYWIPMMRTKYHYLNSEVSFSEGPVSLAATLRQHWGVSRLSQLPALFWSRRKNKRRKKGIQP